MKKGIIFVLLIVFVVFISTSTVSAYSFFGGFFGGKIINMKALEIAELEAFGYNCFVPGTSIEIYPIGSPTGTPTSYFIPSYILPVTNTTPGVGKLILGRYSWKTTIPCIYPSTPPMITIVSLDTITFFGTSRY